MQYNDGVSYDEDTLKVNICPVCNNEQFSSNAEFCRICRTSLYNRCNGDVDYDMNGEPYYRNQHENPSNARFCEICGKPTFFYKKKILVPHTEYNKPIKVLATITEEYSFNPDEATQDRLDIESEKYDYSSAFDEELPFN